MMGQSSSDCQSCPAGWYCDTTGLAEPRAKCAAGAYCITRATQANFTTADNTVEFGACPVDHYCEEGTAVPVSCGNGKTTEGLTSRSSYSDCRDCAAGKYCMSSPVADSTLT